MWLGPQSLLWPSGPVGSKRHRNCLIIERLSSVLLSLLNVIIASIKVVSESFKTQNAGKSAEKETGQ